MMMEKARFFYYYLMAFIRAHEGIRNECTTRVENGC